MLGLGLNLGTVRSGAGFEFSDLGNDLELLLLADNSDNADWQDQSPAGNDATQGTGANQADEVTDGGYAALDFDGTADHMDLPSSALSMADSNGYFVFLVHNPDNNDTSKMILANAASTAAGRRYIKNQSVEFGDTELAIESSKRVSGQRVIQAAWVEAYGAGSRVSLTIGDGTFISTTTETGAINNTWTIGARNGASNFYNGKLTAAVAGKLPSSKTAKINRINQIGTKLASLYGLSWTNIRTDEVLLIIGGASIMQYVIEDNVAAVQRYAQSAFNARVDVRAHATVGHDTSDFLAGLPSVLANYDDIGSSRYDQVLFGGHIGGNNVSANRPEATDPNIATLTSDLDDSQDLVEAKGFEWVLLPLTYRKYGGGPVIDESIGSKPYVDNYYYPRMASKWLNSSGRAIVDMYNYVRNRFDTWFDGSDEVHPATSAEQPTYEFMMDRILSVVYGLPTPADIQIDVPFGTQPTISGTETVGETLTSTNGTYFNSPSSYTYQWQVSDDGSTGWSDISGATSSSYTLTASEEDKYIRLCETATNSEGDSDPNYSDASGQISAAAAAGNEVLIAVGGTDPGGNFNFLDTSSGASATVSNLIDNTGASTAFDVTITPTGDTLAAYNGSSNTNAGSGTGTDLENQDVLISYFFASGSQTEIVFSDLTPSAAYTIRFIASRSVSGRLQDISINGGSAYSYDVGQNPAELYEVTGVTADGSGEISIVITPDNSIYQYVSGVSIQAE